MINLRSLRISPQNQLRQLGWDWMLGQDTMHYITNDVVLIRKNEAEEYGEAVNELYEMFVEAGQYVIDNGLWNTLGIPDNLIELIKLTWEDDRNLHLYGRFDLSGGIAGAPIKLIEFNADTATCIPETAVVQWAQLMANNMNDKMQFNTLYEALTANFRRLKVLYPNLEPTLLLSALADTPEDDANIMVIGEAAREAGFRVAYKYINEVDFSPLEGIFIEEDGRYYQYNFWFKLVPWEYIALDEPELASILTQIVKNQKAVVINPAYTLLFQSKAMLRILWDLYPQHPLLLETHDKALAYKQQVEKVLFGREGANVRILDASGRVQESQEGDYSTYSKIYQAYTPFMTDFAGNCYQPGVFFAYEACGLGFRRGGAIITNTSQFLGHIID